MEGPSYTPNQGMSDIDIDLVVEIRKLAKLQLDDMTERGVLLGHSSGYLRVRRELRWWGIIPYFVKVYEYVEESSSGVLKDVCKEVPCAAD